MNPLLKKYYTRFNVELESNISVPKESKILDLDTKIGQTLLDAGANPKGNENLFPAVTPDGQVIMVTYRLRHILTKQPDTKVGDLTYRFFVENPNHLASKNFWEKVGLPGPLYLWGAASIAKSGKKLLLGTKNPKTAVTYGGLYGPPAGIVELEDLNQGQNLLEALMIGASRELREETGATEKLVNPSRIIESKVYWDIERCKPQYFGLFEFTIDELEEIREGTPTEKEFFKWEIVSYSPEGLAAIALTF
jgi:8-oxo-dGTP pyrophosphatase MutT (NUDIX family)